MKLWCVAAVAMLALAGCSGEESDNEAPDAAMAGDPIQGTQEETQTTAPANQTSATAGNVSSESGATLQMVASNLTGVAPLTVTFNITASGFTDGASWVVDFGDNTTQEGAVTPNWQVNHTFEAGNHTVVLNATDGAESLETSLQVAIAPAPPAGPSAGTPMGSQTIEFSGTITLGSEIPLVQGCGVDDNSQNDHLFDVPLEIDGVPVMITRAVLDMDLGATNMDSDIWVYDGIGAAVGESTEWNYVPVLGSGSPTEHFEATGSWVGGQWLAHVGSCVAVMGDYDVVLTLDFVAA